MNDDFKKDICDDCGRPFTYDNEIVIDKQTAEQLQLVLNHQYISHKKYPLVHDLLKSIDNFLK